MKNFVYKSCLLFFAFYGILGFVSCGDEEPEPVLCPDPSLQLVIAGEVISEGDFFGDVSDVRFNNMDIRTVGIVVNISDGRTVNLSIQRIDSAAEGNCVETGTYIFGESMATCFEIGVNSTICNESDITYIDAQGMLWNDFMQEGEIVVTECNIEKGTITGTFGGQLGTSSSTDIVTISGVFNDIIIEE